MTSSPNHSTSDIEALFLKNILNYTWVSSDYFPVSIGSNSFNSFKTLTINMIPSVIEQVAARSGMDSKMAKLVIIHIVSNTERLHKAMTGFPKFSSQLEIHIEHCTPESVFMNKESEIENQPFAEPSELVSEPVVNESNVECQPKTGLMLLSLRSMNQKREGPREEEQVFLDELERLKRQEKDANEAAEALRKEFAKETKNLIIQEGAAKASSTNIFSTVSTPAKASSTNLINTVSTPVSTANPHEGLSLSDPTNLEQDDSKIPPLEDIYQNSTDGIFTNSSYDDEGAVADFINLETVVNVSHIPTSRIISSHPSALILGDPTLAVQTRSKVNKSSGAHAFVSYNISESLKDESWVDAMQEELLQFKIQKVWILVDLPYRKKAIGTKWVYRNKKDERGVVVRNKARLVAQGHRQEFDVQDYPHRALKNKGIVDSGCSRHMTGNKAYLAEFQDFNGGPVAFGGSKGYITGKGKIKTGKLDFEDVCFVKELQHFNLFSVSQMCDKKNKVLFTDSECLVLSPEFKLPDENQVLLKIPRQNNMYSFNLENIVPSGGLACLIAKATIDESNKWHRRLGHVNFKNLNKLVKGNLVRGLPSKIFQNDHTCVACQKGKQHKASCKAKSVSSISHSLQLLHMDLFGPTSVRSLNHKTYCLVITDDFSRFSWVFFLRTKDETSGILKDFIRQIENQLNQKVKTIRCDNGTEFKNKDVIEFCGTKGIKREYSNARTPQQNGVAERKNRTLIEAAKTIVATSTTEAEYVVAASCCGHHFIRDAYEKKLIQVLKIHTDENVADILTKAFDVSRGLGFRESLRRGIDGTEALLLPTLFILWLDKVSTDRPIVSTDGYKVSTDRHKDSTDGQNEGTDDQIEGTDEQSKGTDDHTEEGSA
ncbi:putative ribonuclease H-like domain-containing protein, partial [Tanacetum coccineum]